MNNNDLIIQNTGALPSPYDERDYDLGIVAGDSIPETLPDSCFIDVSKLPVWHQRKIGACVGHAWGKSQQNCEFVERGKVVNLSARFLYAMAKCRDGYTGEGTYPRLVAQILKDYGCATEDTVPNDTTLDHETYVYNRQQSNIPQAAFLEAKQYGIDGFAWADISMEGIKKAIHYAKTKRQGVVMLMRVGDTYWVAPDGQITWDKNKILPIRRPKEITSGHEIYPCGYEYENKRLKIHFLNSWGEEWADEGKGWFWYDEHADLIVEIMTSIDKTDMPEITFKKDLFFGMTDPDVKTLQETLNKNGFNISEFGPGSPGKETTFYGKLTMDAVKKVQIKYGITPVSGYFGPKTRLVLNKLTSK